MPEEHEIGELKLKYYELNKIIETRPSINTTTSYGVTIPCATGKETDRAGSHSGNEKKKKKRFKRRRFQNLALVDVVRISFPRD